MSVFNGKMSDSLKKSMQENSEIMKKKLQDDFQKIMDEAVEHFNNRVNNIEQDIKGFIQAEVKEQISNLGTQDSETE